MNLDADIVGCPHIALLFQDACEKTKLIKKYKAVLSWNIQRRQEATRPAKRRKISSPTCGTCDFVLSRPVVCLSCSYSGCWRNAHVKQHLQVAGHDLCADVKTGSVFCSKCDDFVYDSSMSHAYSAAAIAAEEKTTTFQVAKKSREPFVTWVPTEKEVAALEGAVAIPCQGRRGLLNLGQTCFMNVILQSFLANTLLRNWFLSDKHNHKLCKAKDCTCCEMDKLFTEIFSENTAPFGPTSFLATTWRASAELSGYAQHDAHEFFISALNQIHGTSRGSTIFSCICIVHSTFGGILQSDVKCERCGQVTSAADPMLDISLELKDKGGEAAGQELTLASCLRKFTQPEKLGPNEYSCAKCGKASHASKRMSIRKLPPVLSFQFKRFEHKSSDKSTARKIEAPVRFSATINMAPYTTLVMDMQEQESKGAGTARPASFAHLGPEALYEYDLFSVVCHEGQIDNGHYTCFSRSQDEWYRFDDDKVTHSSLGACLNSQAYMCFYVKRHLDYKPYMTPSYKVTREAEAVKEKEREREKEAARMREVEDALLATV
ncbi:cysteine proteinase [Amylocystis lapponica]|nr:cysteine proteinase [Amylocystis lapponica]